jgi:hypothetical protein
MVAALRTSLMFVYLYICTCVHTHTHTHKALILVCVSADVCQVYMAARWRLRIFAKVTTY